MNRQLINWQYCSNPNDVNNAIIHHDPDWSGLKSASQIINITYDSNHRSYVVFWIAEEGIL